MVTWKVRLLIEVRFFHLFAVFHYCTRRESDVTSCIAQSADGCGRHLEALVGTVFYVLRRLRRRWRSYQGYIDLLASFELSDRCAEDTARSRTVQYSPPPRLRFCAHGPSMQNLVALLRSLEKASVNNLRAALRTNVAFNSPLLRFIPVDAIVHKVARSD